MTLLRAILVSLAFAAAAGPVAAADGPSPITMRVEPLVAGDVRAGGWAALRVHLENSGPAVDGELRITGPGQGGSTYGIEVQLPTGARQDHVLYGRTGLFGLRYTVTLISEAATLATVRAEVRTLDSETLGAYVVAERPERLVGDVRASLLARQGAAQVAGIRPEDLPPRVEAWGAIDRLVWQDVPATQLDAQQLESLATWVALGGDLIIVGGTTGTGTIGSFPSDLLPYLPERMVDVPPAALAPLLGVVPTTIPLPAAAGPLMRGSALARDGGDVVAAQSPYGQGRVTVIGFDPATPGLAGTAAAAMLWSRILPTRGAPQVPWASQDEGFLEDALSNLPSVDTPRMDQLLVLFLGYVLLLGPVNYLVLRRIDRREWAWLTIPALVVVFTAIALVMGTLLRGTDVIVNQLAIVQGAAGTDRGRADAYVGIFAPTRSTFDVQLPGGALASQTGQSGEGPDRLPLDVLLGDPARVRGFQVGFGSVRGFHAEAAVRVPRIETELVLTGSHLSGSITNASHERLEHVVMAYGGMLQELSALEPGATGAIDLVPGGRVDALRSRIRRLTGSMSDADGRAMAARTAIVRALVGDLWWDDGSTTDPLAAYGPVIVAWASTGALDVDIGVPTEHVGDTLYLLPVQHVVTGPVILTDPMFTHAIVDIDAVEGWEDGGGLYLDRGTVTVAYQVAGLPDVLDVTGLTVRPGSRRSSPNDATAGILARLPDADQPDQVDPLRSGSPPADEGDLPRMQLFDRLTGRWVEFAPMERSRSYRIEEPARFVDPTGGLRVRFVNRDAGGLEPFALGLRVEGVAP